MEFQIPQFIEQKPKIVGPLTLGQFIYIAAAGVISFLAFQVFNFFLWIIITAIVGVLAVGLAFVKVNGQELPKIMGAAISYFWQPKTYTWQREFAKQTVNIKDLDDIRSIRENMSFQDKLKSIALKVSTGKIFSGAGGGVKDEKKYETVVFLTGERGRAKRVDY